MKLLWLTDLHLNFVAHEEIEALLSAIRAKDPAAVLIAGDIGESQNLESCLRLFELRLKAPLYFVLGNHDFYNSSIEKVRSRAAEISAESDRLKWLSILPQPVSLSTECALVGHDGWGDGRYGDYSHSRVILNDSLLIEELRLTDRKALFEKLTALGDESARHIEAVLPQALQQHHKVILLTHVPPFEESSRYHGRVTGPDWQPFFSNKTMGDTILRIMRGYPSRELLILCGHSHGKAEFQPLPNVKAVTGAAEYGNPQIQDVIEVE